MAVQPQEQRPLVPTPDLVRDYIRRFDDSSDGLIDRALATLFQTFPCNDQYEPILFKVLGLNALYNTNIIAVTPVVRHILSLHIDQKLAQRAPELVNEIASTPMKDGEFRRNYSFASQYCSWHVPDAYPIYDSIIDRMIWEYQQNDKFTAFFWRNSLADYIRFTQVVGDFRTYYGLTEFNFRELDKFLWLYGKAYLGK